MTIIYMYIPIIMYLCCLIRGYSVKKLGLFFWVEITVIMLCDNRNFRQLILLDNRNDPFRLLDNPNNLTMITFRFVVSL